MGVIVYFQIILAGIFLCLISSILCGKQQAVERSDLTEKKHEKRGIYDEGYGGFGHEYEEDHHVHHHHEKTIVDVKKVHVPVPHIKTVGVPHIKTIKYPGIKSFKCYENFQLL